jgi:hypothetical protein
MKKTYILDEKILNSIPEDTKKVVEKHIALGKELAGSYEKGGKESLLKKAEELFNKENSQGCNSFWEDVDNGKIFTQILAWLDFREIFVKYRPKKGRIVILFSAEYRY